MGGRLINLSLSAPGHHRRTRPARQRVDNSAPVGFVGQLNPFRQDRALDIKASVTDFQTSSVSTYAGKLRRLRHRKGKLSAKLNYKVGPQAHQPTRSSPTS